MSEQDIKQIVKEKYGQIALRVTNSGGGSCCGSTASSDDCSPITSKLYDASETATLPDAAVAASHGCGNPTALAQLAPGEIVLDLGSGGGIDVLLSAQRVGPTGKAYGLDMTDEMLALARENQRKAGVTNVEFLKGEIESIPLPDETIDVIISNCVINLSADKDRVLAEAFRVLRPGGRLRRLRRRRPWRSAGRRSVAASSCGSGAWPAPWKNPTIAPSSPRPASRRSTSSRRASTVSRTRRSSSTAPASMPRPSRRTSTASS